MSSQVLDRDLTLRYMERERFANEREADIVYAVFQRCGSHSIRTSGGPILDLYANDNAIIAELYEDGNLRLLDLSMATEEEAHELDRLIVAEMETEMIVE